MRKRYKGLSDAEVLASREKNGSNELKRVAIKGPFRRFLENLGDPIIRILIIALGLEVVFTFGNCNFIEIFGIITAILVSTIVSTVSEYSSERAFKRIEEESRESRVRVVRNSEVLEISSSELVVGDIMLISAGERIEADCVMLEGTLATDQSALNGENRDAEKSPGASAGWELSDKGRVFRGSTVVSGEGVVRVMRVGDATYYGMVARDVQSETRESPLKLRLSRLASQISRLGYVVAAIVAFTYLFNIFVVDAQYKPELIFAALSDWELVFTSLIRALTLMITVIVVAVPEGLPMMITVVLSANMKRMVKDNILIKKLVGIETAGSLNILFTDKTGTLTEGKLSVDRIIAEGECYRTRGAIGGEIARLLSLSAFYNTDAVMSGGEAVGGNATDRAILEFFGELPPSPMRIKEQIPFSSEIKHSAVVFDGDLRLLKGAPEVVLSGCNYVLRSDGTTVASDLSDIKRKYESAISNGERVIAVASEDGRCRAFVALIVLKDKVREGVVDAVRSVTQAGIQIVMVTGDNIDTARYIAAECGFYHAERGDVALSSWELAELDDGAVKELLPRLRILARALPQDKTRLVRLSQELELVAGMTGDGVNDAPSLKLADVGFAMGSGTDIAKGAGDIVILDNSFKAISKTVLYGRTIFKSIKKFITFQLIMNLAACGITLLGGWIGIENPITIIQMLWVNIIMDTLGGLAFAGEPPLEYYMMERPKRRDEPILSKDVISHILANGAFTLGLLVFFLKHPYFESFYSAGHSSTALLTAFYALFIFAGLFNALSARCERLWIFSNIGKNKAFVGIMLFIAVIQVLIVYFGGELFRSTPLSAPELLLAVGCAALVIVFDVIRRIIVKLK